MHADAFDASVYDYKEFIRADAPTQRRVVIPPGIDPLGPRSRPVSEEVRQTILAQRGLDPIKPIIGHIVISIREDDPLRVLETFELVKTQRPDAQLLVVNLVTHGADLTDSLNLLRSRGREIGGVEVLSEMNQVGNVELSALRDQATVLVHQGLPRGISVELLEEMWHSRPIVSSRSAVAKSVISHNRTGVLADTTADQAKAILSFLNDPERAARIGTAAHDRIASRHLVSHHLVGYLKLFRQVLHIPPTESRSR
jgi:trehalose synthase